MDQHDIARRLLRHMSEQDLYGVIEELTLTSPEATLAAIRKFTPTTVKFQVIADGIAWIDSDGFDSWLATEADTLAAMLEGIGYTVEVVPL